MIGKLSDQQFRYHNDTAPGRSHFLSGKVVLLLGRSVAHIQEMAARLARQGANIALVGPPLPPMLAQQVRAGVEAGADILLLDNMTLEDLRESVRIVGARARTEASGGITLANVRGVAETGVNSISVGALTHSAPALDLSLRLATS